MYAPPATNRPPEARARKQAAAAIRAGGDKVQLAALKMASIIRHIRNVGGHDEGQESQGRVRLAPAGQPPWDSLIDRAGVKPLSFFAKTLYSLAAPNGYLHAQKISRALMNRSGLVEQADDKREN